ncbi:MAG TPA: glycosyltransferase [Puia sp.]|nr:glycosyltransferase [Puia sp.]
MTSEDFILDLPMCVYKHERYIAQAIEGVVSQKTSFRYRLLIGEDCSPDRSREIIRDYAARYPDRIVPYFHQKNIGVVENSKMLLKACTSKYIALCDGDDYWSDPYKLELQIRFLEENPRFVGCFHNAEERYEDDPDAASYLYCNFPSATSVSFKDLSSGNLMPTCSIVYRNGLFGQFPDWYHTLKMGDWPLHLLNAQFGDFWYIPKVMGVHRLHRTSVWMLQDAERNNKYIEDAYDTMIEGFAANPEHVAFLVAGKKDFLAGVERSKKAAGMKAKMKDLMIRQIRKL